MQALQHIDERNFDDGNLGPTWAAGSTRASSGSRNGSRTITTRRTSRSMDCRRRCDPLTFGNLLARPAADAGRAAESHQPAADSGHQAAALDEGPRLHGRGVSDAIQADGRRRYRDKAVRCLEWLMEHKSPKFEDHAWSNHFDFASRAGRYSRHDPIIVWSALIGQAFLDGYEALGDRRFLDGRRQRVPVDSGAAERANDIWNLHQLLHDRPELRPQREHARCGDAGADMAPHSQLRSISRRRPRP